MRDDDLSKYQGRMHGWLTKSGWSQSLKGLTPSEKFVNGTAQPLAGLTILTPPAEEDTAHAEFYAHLDQVSSRALGAMDGVYNRVPRHCLHVTAADLISGQRYDSYRKAQTAFDDRLANRIKSLFNGQEHASDALSWRIAGLAFFQHALVCLLQPKLPSDYAPLSQLRADIYEDPVCQELGIQSPLPFLAHVTLAYYQVLPSLERRYAWVTHHDDLQAYARSFDANFSIKEIELRAFDDMTAYRAVSPRVRLTFG